MQNSMPNHAITWFARALDTPDISDEEFHGLWYELAVAHETNGDDDEAATLFEKIYAENVGGFRSFDSLGWTSIRDAESALDRLPRPVFDVDSDRVFV